MSWINYFVKIEDFLRNDKIYNLNIVSKVFIYYFFLHSLLTINVYYYIIKAEKKGKKYLIFALKKYWNDAEL